MQIIVMGVSGSGKSYLAARLAAATGWTFAEGDDYHSDANKARMHAGTPLTDAERLPWLETLHSVLLDWQNNGTDGILTCSSLKASYRALLTEDLADVRFVWLDPPHAILQRRLTHRPGHFMPAGLLDSQLATLEPPIGDPRVLRLSGTEAADEEVRTVLAWLRS